jgi:O-antigen/teichoic acid export membrane protein
MNESGTTTGSQKTLSRQLRGSSLLLAGRMISKIVNFGIQVAIVRLLTKDEFGAFAYGLAIVLAGELIVKFGLGRGANRFLPYHAERGERAEVIGILALVCSTIVGLGIVFCAVVWWISGLGWIGFPSGSGGRVVLILAVLAPIQALDTIGIQTLACFSKPRAILFRKHFLGPGLRAAAVLAVFVAGGSSDMLAFAYLAGGILGLLICIGLTHRELRSHGILPLPMRAWKIPLRPLMRFSFPLISSDLVFIATTGVTSVVLMITNGEAGVAAMRAVVPAAALNTLVVQSFSILFMPGAMRIHAQGDMNALRDHHWQSAAWVALLSFPFFALTFGVAPGVVPVLLGEAYAGSASLLAILAVGHYLSVCLAFNGESLQVLERTREIVWTDFLSIFLSLGLAAILCPAWGGLGAAIAVTASRVAGTLARHLILLRTSGFGPVPPVQFRIWGKIALATTAIAGTGWLWQPPFVVQLLLTAVISLALLRSTARALDLTRSFPELLRIPLFVRLVGA